MNLSLFICTRCSLLWLDLLLFASFDFDSFGIGNSSNSLFLSGSTVATDFDIFHFVSPFLSLELLFAVWSILVAESYMVNF